MLRPRRPPVDAGGRTSFWAVRKMRCASCEKSPRKALSWARLTIFTSYRPAHPHMALNIRAHNTLHSQTQLFHPMFSSGSHLSLSLFHSSPLLPAPHTHYHIILKKRTVPAAPLVPSCFPSHSSRHACSVILGYLSFAALWRHLCSLLFHDGCSRHSRPRSSGGRRRRLSRLSRR